MKIVGISRIIELGGNMKAKFDLVQGERNTYGLEINNTIVTNAPKGAVLRHIRSFDVDVEQLEKQLTLIKERKRKC